ncbi:MAG: MotA/TolQ/ExbB proton channel family protein [Leptospiraceae bacterium]|nr:MotA/TolQ/ExbB proton channel family protein [Leptospiraceae bacterium]
MIVMQAYLAGGPVMYLLTILSIVAVALILYSIFRLHSMRSRRAEWQELALAFLQESGDGEAAATRAVQRASFRLQSAIHWLSRLAGMATLLGLLGTVLGISQAFADMQATGQAGPDVFAAGIYEALHTTIAGLLLALPFLLAHHLLRDALSLRQLELLSSLGKRA